MDTTLIPKIQAPKIRPLELDVSPQLLPNVNYDAPSPSEIKTGKEEDVLKKIEREILNAPKVDFGKIDKQYQSKYVQVTPEELSTINEGDEFSERIKFDENYEAVKAATQSEWERAGNTAKKFGAAFTGTFIGGLATIPNLIGSTINGIGYLAGNDKPISDFFNLGWDSGINKGLSDFIDETNKNNRNYKSNWSKENWIQDMIPIWGEGGFQEIVASSGYTFGAIAEALLSGGIASVLSKGTKLAGLGGKVAKYLNSPEKLDKVIDAFKLVNKEDDVRRILGETGYMIGKGIEKSPQLYRALLGGHVEGAFEGLEGAKRFEEEAIKTYKEKNFGMSPDQKTLEKIRDVAHEVGDMRYKLNLAILTIPNYLQMGALLKTLPGAEKMSKMLAGNKLIGELDVDRLAFKVRQASDVKMNWNLEGKIGRNFEKGVNAVVKGVQQYGKIPLSLSEGGEEYMQYIIDEYTSSLYKGAYMSPQKAKDVGDYLSQMFKTLSETGTNKEAIQSLLMGSVSGGLQQTFNTGYELATNSNKLKNKIASNEVIAAKLEDLSKRMFSAESIKETIDDNDKEVLLDILSKSLNQNSINGTLEERYNNALTSLNGLSVMEDILNSADLDAHRWYYNVKDRHLSQLLHEVVSTGKQDVFKEHLKEIAKADPQAINELYGIKIEEQTRSQEEFVNDVLDKLNKIEKTSEQINFAFNDVFDDPLTATKYNLYKSELSHLKFMIDRQRERRDGLKSPKTDLIKKLATSDLSEITSRIETLKLVQPDTQDYEESKKELKRLEEAKSLFESAFIYNGDGKLTDVKFSKLAEGLNKYEDVQDNTERTAFEDLRKVNDIAALTGYISDKSPFVQEYKKLYKDDGFKTYLEERKDYFEEIDKLFKKDNRKEEVKVKTDELLKDVPEEIKDIVKDEIKDVVDNATDETTDEELKNKVEEIVKDSVPTPKVDAVVVSVTDTPVVTPAPVVEPPIADVVDNTTLDVIGDAISGQSTPTIEGQIGTSNYYVNEGLIFYKNKDESLIPIPNPNKKNVSEAIKDDIEKRRQEELLGGFKVEDNRRPTKEGYKRNTRIKINKNATKISFEGYIEEMPNVGLNPAYPSMSLEEFLNSDFFKNFKDDNKEQFLEFIEPLIITRINLIEIRTSYDKNDIVGKGNSGVTLLINTTDGIIDNVNFALNTSKIIEKYDKELVALEGNKSISTPAETIEGQSYSNDSIVDIEGTFETEQGSVYTIKDGKVSRFKKALLDSNYTGSDKLTSPLKAPTDIIFFYNENSSLGKGLYNFNSANLTPATPTLTWIVKHDKVNKKFIRVDSNSDLRGNPNNYYVITIPQGYTQSNQLSKEFSENSMKKLVDKFNSDNIGNNKQGIIKQLNPNDISFLPKIGMNPIEWRVDKNGVQIGGQGHTGNKVIKINTNTVNKTSAPSETIEGKKVYFGGFDNGVLLSEYSTENFVPNKSIIQVELNPNSPSTAEFTITNNAYSINTILSNISVYENGIDFKELNYSGDTIQVIKKGKVVLSGGNWKVVDKAQISVIDSKEKQTDNSDVVKEDIPPNIPTNNPPILDELENIKFMQNDFYLNETGLNDKLIPSGNKKLLERRKFLNSIDNLNNVSWQLQFKIDNLTGKDIQFGKVANGKLLKIYTAPIYTIVTDNGVVLQEYRDLRNGWGLSKTFLSNLDIDIKDEFSFDNVMLLQAKNIDSVQKDWVSFYKVVQYLEAKDTNKLNLLLEQLGINHDYLKQSINTQKALESAEKKGTKSVRLKRILTNYISSPETQDKSLHENYNAIEKVEYLPNSVVIDKDGNQFTAILDIKIEYLELINNESEGVVDEDKYRKLLEEKIDEASFYGTITTNKELQKEIKEKLIAQLYEKRTNDDGETEYVNSPATFLTNGFNLIFTDTKDYRPYVKTLFSEIDKNIFPKTLDLKKEIEAGNLKGDVRDNGWFINIHGVQEQLNTKFEVFKVEFNKHSYIDEKTNKEVDMNGITITFVYTNEKNEKQFIRQNYPLATNRNEDTILYLTGQIKKRLLNEFKSLNINNISVKFVAASKTKPKSYEEIVKIHPYVVKGIEFVNTQENKKVKKDMRNNTAFSFFHERVGIEIEENQPTVEQIVVLPQITSKVETPKEEVVYEQKEPVVIDENQSELIKFFNQFKDIKLGDAKEGKIIFTPKLYYILEEFINENNDLKTVISKIIQDVKIDSSTKESRIVGILNKNLSDISEKFKNCNQ